MALHDISDKRIEEYIRHGIRRNYNCSDIDPIAIKDIEWSRKKVDSDGGTDEDPEFHVYVEATIICFVLEESCRINVTRDGYLFTEEGFELSLNNYDEFYPDVSWYEGISDKYYQLSEELPKGMDFMVTRYIKDNPGYLWRFLDTPKVHKEFIKNIHSKLLRNAVENLWAGH